MSNNPTYKIQEIHSDDLKKEIKALVEASNDTVTERNLEFNKSITFTKIKLNKHKLFYYLRNNRTKKDCKDYIRKLQDSGKSISSDFFSEENMDLTAAQQAYHGIIYRHADVETIENTYKQQEEQKYPIYITSNGVIANGNTRVSVLRERLEWIDVECLVYPEDLSENWELIEVHTSEKDNVPYFQQEDAWYGKQETYIDLKSRGYDDEKVARRMNNFKTGDRDKPDVASLLDDVERCNLVQEFLDFDPNDKFTYVSDLEKLSERGGGDGKQAFTTLQTKLKALHRNHDYPFQVIERVKDIVFNMMAGDDKSRTNAGLSDHKFIQTVCSKQYVDELLLEFKKKTDESSEESEIWSPIVESTNEDRTGIVKSALDQAKKAAEFANEDAKRKGFVTDLSNAHSSLVGAIQKFDKDSSLRNDADTYLEGMERHIKAIRELLKE